MTCYDWLTSVWRKLLNAECENECGSWLLRAREVFPPEQWEHHCTWRAGRAPAFPVPGGRQWATIRVRATPLKVWPTTRGLYHASGCWLCDSESEGRWMEWRDSTNKYLRKLRMEKGGKGDNQQNINEVIKHEETRLYVNVGNGLLPTV